MESKIKTLKEYKKFYQRVQGFPGDRGPINAACFIGGLNFYDEFAKFDEKDTEIFLSKLYHFAIGNKLYELICMERMVDCYLIHENLTEAERCIDYGKLQLKQVWNTDIKKNHMFLLTGARLNEMAAILYQKTKRPDLMANAYSQCLVLLKAANQYGFDTQAEMAQIEERIKEVT